MEFAKKSTRQLSLMLLTAGIMSLSLQDCRGRFKSTFLHPSEKIGIQVAPRDAFPVFDNPEFVNSPTAEAEGYVHDRDPVIGLVINGKAKAYPIRTMGIHELGNDTLGDVPIAVSW